MLIPTIQTDSIDELQAKINAYAAVDLPHKPTHFQIDIVDGLYADDLTIIPHELGVVDWRGFTFETHLLTVDPDEYIGESDSVGATTIIGQIERLENRSDFLKVIKQLKRFSGLALDIYTPIAELTDEELTLTDLILLMAVPAGQSGQELKPLIFNQITNLRSRGFTKLIEIDGGVNALNLSDLKKAGADMFAVNSSLWHDGDIENNLKNLISAL